MPSQLLALGLCALAPLVVLWSLVLRPMPRRAWERRNSHGDQSPKCRYPAAGNCMERDLPCSPPCWTCSSIPGPRLVGEDHFVPEPPPPEPRLVPPLPGTMISDAKALIGSIVSTNSRHNKRFKFRNEAPPFLDLRLFIAIPPSMMNAKRARPQNWKRALLPNLI